jgi:hypothetical protein
MLRDRSYVCAGATELPSRGGANSDRISIGQRGNQSPIPSRRRQPNGGREEDTPRNIWYVCQTFLPRNFCPVPDCLTILRADHARERDHRDRLPRPGHLNGQRTPPRLKLKAIVCGKTGG